MHLRIHRILLVLVVALPSFSNVFSIAIVCANEICAKVTTYADMSAQDMHGFMCPEDVDSPFQLDGHATIICDSPLPGDFGQNGDHLAGGIGTGLYPEQEYCYGAFYYIDFKCNAGTVEVTGEECQRLMTGQDFIPIGEVCTSVVGDQIEVTIEVNGSGTLESWCCLKESHICNYPTERMFEIEKCIEGPTLAPTPKPTEVEFPNACEVPVEPDRFLRENTDRRMQTDFCKDFFYEQSLLDAPDAFIAVHEMTVTLCCDGPTGNMYTAGYALHKTGSIIIAPSFISVPNNPPTVDKNVEIVHMLDIAWSGAAILVEYVISGNVTLIGVPGVHKFQYKRVDGASSVDLTLSAGQMVDIADDFNPSLVWAYKREASYCCSYRNGRWDTILETNSVVDETFEKHGIFTEVDPYYY